jgi:hypothetical protein
LLDTPPISGSIKTKGEPGAGGKPARLAKVAVLPNDVCFEIGP